jgi:hypothetical protein
MPGPQSGALLVGTAAGGSPDPVTRVGASSADRRWIVGGSSLGRSTGASSPSSGSAGRSAAERTGAAADRPVMRSRRDRRRPAHALLYYPGARGIVGRPRPSA